MTDLHLTAGELIDQKYRIVASIGSGAWGHVYEGVNERIERRVAIKIMHSEYASKPDMRARFEREARSSTRIDSEYVVHVFDMGVLPDGRPYIVMELLKGEDLGKRIQRVKHLPLEEVLTIGIQALRGLSDAHESGILHRDIKPDNIVIVKGRQGDAVKIVDFGISKLVQEGETLTRMTATSQFLGSPVYMSPEQCRGVKNLDHRSDLYSLGVTLFEAATGRLPFDAEAFNELMFKIALEDAPDPRTFMPDLDANFAQILQKSMARDPNHRFQSAKEFEQTLLEWGESMGILSPDWRRSSTSQPNLSSLSAAAVVAGSRHGMATTNRPVSTRSPEQVVFGDRKHDSEADTMRPKPMATKYRFIPWVLVPLALVSALLLFRPRTSSKDSPSASYNASLIVVPPSIPVPSQAPAPILSVPEPEIPAPLASKEAPESRPRTVPIIRPSTTVKHHPALSPPSVPSPPQTAPAPAPAPLLKGRVLRTEF